MEKKATSETPEKGFVESDLCTAVNPGGDKLLERPGELLLCNMTDNVVVGSSVKVGTGVDSVMSESDVVTGNNNEKGKGFLDVDLEDKSLVLNDVGDNDASLLEGDLKFGEKNETTIEVSGDGIDVFVEVFGPLDGMYDSSNEDGGDGLEQDCADKSNGTVAFDGKSNAQDANAVGKEERLFGVGDLVWVKSRTQVWWPGMISDISNDGKDDGTIPGEKGSFLVKYFGKSTSVWCSNSDMKPFIECFDELSQKSTSRTFTGSVQKALGEVSQRIKSKMSCPCFTKESEPRAQRLDDNKVCNYDVWSVPQFDPTSFYESIRELASTGLVPGKVDRIIMESCLSAFYRWVGHRQLPLQLLKPSSDDDVNLKDNIAERRSKRNCTVTTSPVPDDDSISSGKGYVSRSRKKSKYLSYPYVDASKEVDASKVGEVDKSNSKANVSGANSRKRASKKHLKAHRQVDSTNACPAELLQELLATALDPSYLSRSKYSDSLSNFFCGFRMYAFQDAKISLKLQEVEIEEDIKTVKESEDQGVNHEPAMEHLNTGASNKLSEQNNLPVKGNAVRKRSAKKKKEEETPANLESKTDSFPLVPCVINFQRTWSDVPESENTPDSKAATTEIPMITKPDSGGFQPVISSGGPSADRGKHLPENSNGAIVSPNDVRQATTFTSFPSLRDVPVTFQSIPQVNSVGLNSISGDVVFTGPTPSTGNIGINSPVQNPVSLTPSSGLNDTCQVQSGNFIFKKPNPTMIAMGLGSPIQNSIAGASPSGQPERKKRKRKEKTSQVASAIPDLNGNASGKAPAERNVGQQPNESGLNPKRRVFTPKEDPGGGLLLKFAPEFPPPSKETLVATFSRFGLLKESEIQFLGDSSCTQIMYERSSDAGFAFRSLEKSNPFGASLVSFNLHCMPGTDAKPAVKKRKVRAQQQQQPIVETSKSPGKQPAMEINLSPAKPGDMAAIKKNVEMMKAALENAGDSLSPEMKARLKNEIKRFLDKIGGGSS